jgi:hypothetical protein
VKKVGGSYVLDLTRPTFHSGLAGKGKNAKESQEKVDTGEGEPKLSFPAEVQFVGHQNVIISLTSKCNLT